MCFTIHPDHREPKIATEDIICYKVFEYPMGKFATKEAFFSIFQCFRYQKGSIYSIERIEPIIESIEPIIYKIEAGFHSYMEPCTNNFGHEWNGWNSAIQVKCKIPAGTLYYYNPGDADGYAEYVSEAIIIGTDKDIIPYPKQ